MVWKWRGGFVVRAWLNSSCVSQEPTKLNSCNFRKLDVFLNFPNLNQMPITCPTNCGELRQFKIWKDLLHLRTKVLSPNTLETNERRSLLPAFEGRWIGDGAASRGGERERLHFSCPSGIKEEWDGETLGHRRRWQNPVEWGDIDTRSKTIKDVADCKALRLAIKNVKLHNVNAHHLPQTNLKSWAHLPIRLKERRIEDL